MNTLEGAVVISQYKNAHLVIDALVSLAEQKDPDRWRVIVVDNCSDDGSFTSLENKIKEMCWEDWVETIQAPRNGGFSYANNMGIKHIQADNYILLNSDTIVPFGAVAKLLDAAKENPWAGIIIPQLEWPDGSPQINQFLYRTPFNEFLHTASTGLLTKLFGLIGQYEVALPPDNKDIDPEWVSLACALISKETFAKVGYLDSGYYLYCEDMDYCRRAREAGVKFYFFDQARVIHLNYGLSASETRKRLPNYYYVSRSRYFKKFYGRIGLIAANLLWTLGFLVSLLRRLHGRKFPFPKYAWMDIWTDVFSPVRL